MGVFQDSWNFEGITFSNKELLDIKKSNEVMYIHYNFTR